MTSSKESLFMSAILIRSEVAHVAVQLVKLYVIEVALLSTTANPVPTPVE